MDKWFASTFTPDVVADYMIPHDFFLRLAALSGIIGTVLLGNTVRLFNTANKVQTARVNYAYSTVLTLLFMLLITLNIWLYGRDFLLLWVGNAVTENMVKTYLIMSVAFFLNSFGWLGFNLMIARDKFRVVSWLYWGVPFILIVAYLGVMSKFGVVGLAIAVAFSKIVDIALFIIGMRIGGVRLSYLLQAFKAQFFRCLVVLFISGVVYFTLYFYVVSPLLRLSVAVVINILMVGWFYHKGGTSRYMDDLPEKNNKLGEY